MRREKSKISRRKFIEAHGATCGNWTWSWSFVNHDAREVIFGAWTHYAKGDTCLILDDSWEVRRGRRQPGYMQAREHLRLIECHGYQLKTFPIIKSDTSEGSEAGPASIGAFYPELSVRRLVRAGSSWYAEEESHQVSEELPGVCGDFAEGASMSVTVNAYERSGRARAACLAHHGFKCAVCGFDFERAYGSLGKDYIHVHHVVPLSSIRRTYVVDPTTDLIPVCPNCHALIHRTHPALTIDEMRVQLKGQESVVWPLKR